MSESIGSSGPGMKLHTKILLGLAVGLVAGITTNLTVGVDNAAVGWINRFVAVPLGQIFPCHRGRR